MDFRDSPAENQFRMDLRTWLHDNLRDLGATVGDAGEADAEQTRAWHRRLYAAGYAGLSWPIEYGGRGLNSSYEAILNEEAGRLGAPALPAIVNYLGRSIYTYGAEEQQRRFLRPLLSGEEQWCQGFSEPGAGSDLAALSTAADMVGDTFVIRGQKAWTSLAQYADWCFLLARTERDRPRHHGLSCLLVPMTAPGITVRPIVLSNGVPETCEVFFDDVVVGSDALLGARGQGWTIAMTTLAYERGPADTGVISAYQGALGLLEATAAEKGRLNEDGVRKAFAKAYVRGEALRINVIQQLSMRANGRDPGNEISVAKLLATDADQSLHHLALDLLGAEMVTDLMHPWLERYLRSRTSSVFGGTSQIQKNLLARRVLGMPQ